MNKLKLNWEELVVESFTTASDVPARGTVRGNASYVHDGCLTETDEWSCPGSCEPVTCEEYCGGGSGGCGGETIDDPSCSPTGPAPDTCCQQMC